MNLILLGAPGAGKGTLAAFLIEKMGAPSVSTGNILREAIANNTALGQKAKQYMDAGQLVPDQLVIDLLKDRIAQDDCKDGFILDGFPRTIPQAEALEKAGITFDAVVSLEISDDEIVDRMGGRRVCASCGAPYHVKNLPPKVEGVCDACGGKLEARADDKPEVVRDRLKVYHKETAPLKDFYAERNLLKTVDNQPTVAETTAAILKALGL